MGAVYRAWDLREGREVAVKVLEAHLDEAETNLRFRREYRALARLRHPHIVTVYDFKHEQEQTFLVMEFIRGVTLAKYRMLQGGKLSAKTLLDFSRQLVDALVAIHGAGLIHRDLTPNNIMITGNRVTLMDFGLVKSAEPDEMKTMPGMLLGTMHYISPEQVRGEEVDCRGDLYSLGIVMYEALTGVRPFVGDDPIAVLVKHVTELPKSPRRYEPSISEAWESLILKLLEKNPCHRYQSSDLLLAALAELDHNPYQLSSKPEARADSMFKPALLERANELQLLHEAYKDSTTAGVMVWLTGEAGIGKTRLITELTTDLSRQSVEVIYIPCYEKEPIPYQALQSLLRILADKTSKVAALGLARQPGLDDDEVSTLSVSLEQLSSPNKRFEVFARIISVIDQSSQQQPLVLIFDNMQWLDADTLAFLSYFIRQLGQMKVLLIGVYREEEVAISHPLRKLYSVARRSVSCRELNLVRLSSSAVTKMIRQMLGGANDVDWISDVIYGESEGNPLFVIELLKIWIEEGKLVRAAGRWDYRTTITTTIPGTIREIVIRRRSRLSPGAQLIVDLVSVIGRSARYEVLAAMSQLDEEQILDALEELVRSGVVNESADYRGEFYEFSHHQLRQVTYDLLEGAKRKLHHLKAAQALNKLYGDKDPELIVQLAEHYYLAESWLEALPYLEQAVQIAMTRMAYDRAELLCNYALETLGRLAPNQEKRLNLLLTKLKLSAKSSSKSLTHDLVDEIWQSAVALNKTTWLPGIIINALMVNINAGDFSDFERHLLAAEQINNLIQDSYLETTIYIARGFNARYAGGYPEAARYFSLGLAKLKQEGRWPTLVSTVLRELGNIHVAERRYEQGFALHEEAAAWRRSHDIPDDVFDLHDSANCYYLMNRFAEGYQLASRAWEEVAKSGFLWMKTLALSMMGFGLLRLGNFNEARERLRESISEAKKTGTRFWGLELRSIIHVLIFSGLVPEAYMFLSNHLDYFEKSGSSKAEAGFLSAFMLLEMGKKEAALVEVENLSSLHGTEDDSWGRTWLTLGEALRAALINDWGKVVELLPALTTNSDYNVDESGIRLWLRGIGLANLGALNQAFLEVQQALTSSEQGANGWFIVTAFDLAASLARSGWTSQAETIKRLGAEVAMRYSGENGLKYWSDRQGYFWS